MKVERLPEGKARVYLRKAQEFARAMDAAVARRDWNAVGLNAVHAVISAVDAVTTSRLGQRSRSTEHLDAVGLLERTGIPDAHERASQALKVLEQKNLVEYEAREFEEEEAQSAALRARRFLAWAESQLP